MKKGIKKGDEVLVLCGDDKGKRGSVLRVIRETNQVVVSGVAVCKRHTRKNANNPEGAILELERPIHRSNVRLAMARDERQAEGK